MTSAGREPTAGAASGPSTNPSLPAGTFLGPDGVESSAIVQENELPGTRTWKISRPGPGYVVGFANTTYAAAGQSVELYVSTSARRLRFHVEAYRMGYYGGDGARLVWTSAEVTGRHQHRCPVTPVTNMVSCDNWKPTLAVPITASWTQGDYLLKLVGAGRQQSYIPLTIWDPHSDAAYLVVARSLVEEAWNPYGGYDMYQGEGPCPAGAPVYPVCDRARVVSFDRPYSIDNGAADFLYNEDPLVFWGEEHGLDFAYVTDVTVAEHPAIMSDHRAILSLGHDEMWTNAERVGALRAVARGVNIVFFGAAATVRHARLQASRLGPDREVVDYRDAAEDPLNGVASPWKVTGNTWDSPPTNWNEDTLTGEAYAGYNISSVAYPFVVYDPSSWVFRGTGLTRGSRIPDVIRSDIDHVETGDGAPSDLQVLGHSPLPVPPIYTNQGVWSGRTFSDMTYWTSPSSRSGVIDTGDVNWIAALNTCRSAAKCPKRALQRITGNILALFGQGPAGRTEPSHANVARVRPPGS